MQLPFFKEDHIFQLPALTLLQNMGKEKTSSPGPFSRRETGRKNFFHIYGFHKAMCFVPPLNVEMGVRGRGQI